MRGLNAPPRSILAPAAATPSAVSMICFSLSTEQGPAITTNSSPPISVPLTRMTRASLAEFLADELVRGGNAHRTLHARRGFERFQAGGDVADADDADHDALLAFNGMDLVAKLRDPFADVVDFFRVAWGRMEIIMQTVYTIRHAE